MAFIDKLMPLPKGGKDLNDENSVPVGNYTEIALTLNNLFFAIFSIFYIWSFVSTFIV